MSDTFKCGHELTRENTTPRGRCRQCWNAYHRAYQTGPRSQRPEDLPPADLAELAKTRNKTMLRNYYGVGEDRLNKWLRVAGVEAATNLCIRRRHVPDDFAEIAPAMSAAALSRHYKVDWTTVRRWKEESGVESMSADVVRRQTLAQHRPARNNRLPPHAFVFKGSAAVALARDMRPFTLHDRAADDLRRERWAVHRCDDRGRYAEKGKLWRVGNVICTPDELLQRAAKYRSRAA